MKFTIATVLCSTLVVTTNVAAFSPNSGFTAGIRLRSQPAANPTTLSMTTNTPDPAKRIVITGMGITSCLGNTLEDVKTSLLTAKSGIKVSPDYVERNLRSHICGSPDLTDEDFRALIPKASLRFMGPNAKFAYIAMARAIEDAGLEKEDYEENPRVAGILGQGGTSTQDIYETMVAVESGAARWKNKVGPFRVTRSMGSTVSAVLSTAFKLQGPSFSISRACSTGAHCIGTGYQQILLGNSDMAFCGAGENEGWAFTAMFDCMGALSTSYNDTPETASRAFDQSRDGFVIAGGGGVLILEELEHAKARNAKIYAEVVGYAANSDGYDMVAPSGVGGENCMKLAMEEANRRGGEKEVDYINTHGTSTPVGDVMELAAIKRRFEEEGYKPNVGSTKSLSGHALGAAGVHEAIYSVLMMDNDFMAQSANIETLAEEAEGMNILTERKDGPFKRAMSNSFGFGGTNCALVFDKYEEE